MKTRKILSLLTSVILSTSLLGSVPVQAATSCCSSKTTICNTQCSSKANTTVVASKGNCNNKTCCGTSSQTANKPSQTTSTNTSTTASSSFSAFQNEVLRLVNVERTKAHLKPLTMNTKLSEIATLKSQDMINKNYFDHTSPTYGSPFDMMKKYGINYTAAGENIAMGQATPAEVMTGWMNSPGHRQNILNPNFEQLGVGVAKNSSGRLYWTQMFIK